jgi:Dehydrogenases with different specificities (related to short-chain alcohol dehydrogenases)
MEVWLNYQLKRNEMYTLRNKTAIITGSARGLGKAIAERYAALGAKWRY